MVYQITYSQKVDKQLEKLDSITRERIIAVIDRCKINPYSYVIKVIGTDYFRARAGDWRIFMKIENHKLLILVLKIGKRENVYDKK